MSSTNKTITFVVVAALIILGIVMFTRGSDTNVPAYSSDSVLTTSPISTKPVVKSYTQAEIALHSNSSNCWTSINGSVYDLTTWIKQHPGGSQAILGLCGKDGSIAFNSQHGGQPNPAMALEAFLIGTLKK